ncbi:MAG TPA: type VI secretion system baseplate subunit TssK [Bryobacteraceae bacterium]|nr:type VI secretion system baseplate subunit TssK [Bryobacteraceae bacterium]
MKNLSRVVWSEGMYLGPHHFQAQSRYFEDSIRFVADALWLGTHGLTGGALDEEALSNGTVAIVHARGIMPDGTAFHMPESDPLPAPRDVGAVISPASNRLTVLLALPWRKPNGGNCTLNPAADANGSRYIAETETLHDDTTGQDEKPVRIGRKNLRILFETELTEDWMALPIARVMRSGSGRFVFDPAFIGPTLQIGASRRLMSLLGPLIELMEEKIGALTRSAEASGGAVGFSTREIASFWFLHTVNASLSPLRHFYFSKRGHPQELYLELSRLAGALCTFALESHPRTLPAYDHDHPDECFDALDRHIREHLELIIPTNCLSIPLHSTADYFYAGEVTDPRCFGRSTWYFAVRAEMGEMELVAHVPQLVKICSEKFIAELVKRALPGLPLAHVPTPPPAIAARVETQYFLVSKSGPFWDHIVNTKHVGIYVPGDIPKPEIQLFAVIDS